MTPENRPTKMLNTRIEMGFFIEFQAACEERNMNASEAVREALSLWMNDTTKADAMEAFRTVLNNDKAMNAAWAVLRGDSE